MKENLSATSEGFDVGCVFGKDLYKLSGKAILAANIAKRSCQGCKG